MDCGCQSALLVQNNPDPECTGRFEVLQLVETDCGICVGKQLSVHFKFVGMKVATIMF